MPKKITPKSQAKNKTLSAIPIFNYFFNSKKVLCRQIYIVKFQLHYKDI